MNTSKSEILFGQSKKVIPGGVNSPVRGFGYVGGTPRFIEKAEGAFIWDVDGNKYIDYMMSWGPMLLGHAHPKIIEAINKTARNGTTFGASTRLETKLAEMIIERVPSIEKVRLVNSGTEACMTAIRLARGFTGRNLIVKFDGCYHGHSDSFQVKAGSGLMTDSISSGSGIPGEIISQTISLPYNNTVLLEELFTTRCEEIACIILEPVAANMGIVLPTNEFISTINKLCKKYDALQIYDEVITGFRLERGGAQEYFNIKPDLTCLGKIIGGGLPLAALGGRRDVMEQLAPLGNVYQAGTLSGNPLAVSAGIAMLEEIDKQDTYNILEKTGKMFADGINQILNRNNLKYKLTRIGSLMTLFFTENEVVDYTTALTCEQKKYAKFFHGTLDRGIYFPPSQFESWFLSIAHSEEFINKTLSVIDEIFSS